MADEDKKVIVPSAAGSSIRPSDATRIAPAAQETLGQRKLKTIKLKPLTTVAPAQDVNEEETVSFKRDSIKLAPDTSSAIGEEDATVGINKMNTRTVLQATPSDQSVGDEDATVKIQKTQKPQSSSASPIPGVKQTIKLRPSSMSAESSQVAPTPNTTKDTMKLTPAPSSAPSEDSEPDSAEDATKKTIKLVAKKPSAPTVKLDEPSSAPTVLTPDSTKTPISETHAPKKTLKIKAPGAPPPPMPPSTDVGMDTEHGAPPVMEAGQQPGGAQQYQLHEQYKVKENEASTLTTIAASISLLALGYFTYQLFAQYKELFM